jgi:hypothetical protein
MNSTIKFPEPQKIDYTKYIEPKTQIFATAATGATIAILTSK